VEEGGNQLSAMERFERPRGQGSNPKEHKSLARFGQGPHSHGEVSTSVPRDEKKEGG